MEYINPLDIPVGRCLTHEQMDSHSDRIG